MADQKAVSGVRRGSTVAKYDHQLFGGMVELLFTNGEEWKPYGLTCLHSARPLPVQRSQDALQTSK